MSASQIFYNANTTEEDDGVLFGDTDTKIPNKIGVNKSRCVKTACCEPVGLEITPNCGSASLTQASHRFLPKDKPEEERHVSKPRS